MYFTLPRPLAKLGATLIDRTFILICGGMSGDYEAKKETYVFNLEKTKWKQVADMSCARLLTNGPFATNGYVFAIGGTID